MVERVGSPGEVTCACAAAGVARTTVASTRTRKGRKARPRTEGIVTREKGEGIAAIAATPAGGASPGIPWRRRIFQGQGAAMRFGDLPAEGQSDPGAGGFGRKEGDEQVGSVGESRSFVLHRHLDAAVDGL